MTYEPKRVPHCGTYRPDLSYAGKQTSDRHSHDQIRKQDAAFLARLSEADFPVVQGGE